MTFLKGLEQHSYKKFELQLAAVKLLKCICTVSKNYSLIDFISFSSFKAGILVEIKSIKHNDALNVN